MFFDPHLAQQAEEDAAAEVSSSSSSSLLSSPSIGDGVTRVVGTVERIQVELSAGAVPNSDQSVQLPDGRVVKFQVPASFQAGEIIEVEVSRQKFQEVTKAHLVSFFSNGIKVMKESRAETKASAKPGEALVEIQQREFDKLGIDRKAGCQAAGKQFTDPELRTLQQEFMRTAQREYLSALEAKDLKPLKTPMDKAQIIEFFNACNTKVALEETKQMLAEVAKKTKKPNEAMIRLQRDMLETLGVEAEYGCQCLNRMGTDFPGDQDLMNAMQMWAMTATNACKVAMQEADPDLQPDSPAMRDMSAVQAQAAVKLETMSHQDQQILVDKMRKKVDVFQKLSAPDRMRYVTKLNDADKLDFVCAQILLMKQMNQKMADLGISHQSSTTSSSSSSSSSK